MDTLTTETNTAQPTRAEVAQLLASHGWRLVNFEHDVTKALPRCLAEHDQYGQVCGIYPSELVRSVRHVEYVAREFELNGARLMRANVQNPFSVWTTERGMLRGSWAAELVDLWAIMAQRPGWLRAPVDGVRQ